MILNYTQKFVNEINEEMNRTLRFVMIASIIMAIFIMFLAQALAFRIARPIELIAEVAQKIASGDIEKAINSLPGKSKGR